MTENPIAFIIDDDVLVLPINEAAIREGASAQENLKVWCWLNQLVINNYLKWRLD